MAAPAMLGLALFIALPFALAVVISMSNLRLGSPLPAQFIGLEQYRRIFTDEVFLRALMNNSIFALVVVPVQTCLALGLALLLNRGLRGMVLFRTLFFMPVVFPMSLVSVVWILIYEPGPAGMMNAILGVITLGHWEAVDFLHDPFWALPAIMLTSIWQGVGFQMVVMLAGLQSIPEQLYEAARVDGAGRWSRFYHVTLPQMRNTIIFVVLVTSILAFRLFDQVQIMTRGGPGDTTTTVIFESVRAAFERQQAGRGAAMTVVFFFIVLVITWCQRRFLKQEREIQ